MLLSNKSLLTVGVTATQMYCLLHLHPVPAVTNVTTMDKVHKGNLHFFALL